MNRFNYELYCVQEASSSHRCARAPLVSPSPHPDSIYFPECLGSFLTRTAQYLSLTKSELIENYVLPRTSLDYTCRFLDSGRDSYSINSVGSVAHELELSSKGLFSKFTHHEFSSYSFLQPLLGVKAKSLVSRHLHWCPDCLNEWRRNKVDIYYPLYWMATETSACLKHHTSLSGKCPCCSKAPNTMTSLSVQGYCDYCGEWLGKAKTNTELIDEASLWKTYAINQLILHRHLLQQADVLTNFRRFIANLAEANGCARNVERKLGLSESLIVRWRKRNRPKASQMLDMAYKLGLYPHQILLGQARAKVIEDKVLDSQCDTRSQKRTKDLLSGLDLTINQRCESHPDISLKKLSRNLNVSVGFIRYRYPEIAEELSSKSINRDSINYSERNYELCLAATQILVKAYEANKFIGTHQLRELLQHYPGFGHLSMPVIRRFILNNSLDGVSRNLMGLITPCHRENLLLHSKHRRINDE